MHLHRPPPNDMPARPAMPAMSAALVLATSPSSTTVEAPVSSCMSGRSGLKSFAFVPKSRRSWCDSNGDTASTVPCHRCRLPQPHVNCITNHCFYLPTSTTTSLIAASGQCGTLGTMTGPPRPPGRATSAADTRMSIPGARRRTASNTHRASRPHRSNAACTLLHRESTSACSTIGLAGRDKRFCTARKTHRVRGTFVNVIKNVKELTKVLTTE